MKIIKNINYLQKKLKMIKNIIDELYLSKKEADMLNQN